MGGNEAVHVEDDLFGKGRAIRRELAHPGESGVGVHHLQMVVQRLAGNGEVALKHHGRLGEGEAVALQRRRRMGEFHAERLGGAPLLAGRIEAVPRELVALPRQALKIGVERGIVGRLDLEAAKIVLMPGEKCQLLVGHAVHLLVAGGVLQLPYLVARAHATPSHTAGLVLIHSSERQRGKPRPLPGARHFHGQKHKAAARTGPPQREGHRPRRRSCAGGEEGGPPAALGRRPGGNVTRSPCGAGTTQTGSCPPRP